MTDTDYLVRMACACNPLREPVLRSAIETLQLPPGSRGLDAGCAIGLQSLLLAEAVGPAGHVTGLDISPELLDHAEEMVKRAGLSERIALREGDVSKLPFEDDTFDWVWSADCVGYGPMEPLPLIMEMARVVKPGGSVAILAWSSEELLPGYPLLEARLSATTAGIAPFVAGRAPESHFLRALGWFRDAGLREPTAHTFVGTAHAPLSKDIYNGLEALFQMRWPGVEEELAQQGADGERLSAEYRRLCLPESPDLILHHPDYVAFFTYSMFHGKVA
jgi:demethylmenaquinone methyltransferase/2-methoxy-6-polyprenyl-1,4-benzoquinol methylase